MRARLAVLISGNGSNLQALLQEQNQYDLRLVIAGKPTAYGVKRARRAGVPVLVAPSELKKEALDRWIHEQLLLRRIEVVCLAGFMRVLGHEFVQSWKGRMMNIHPSLLPKYPGLRGFESALEAGDSHAGATVHLVSEEVDAGLVILQRHFRIPKCPSMALKSLALHITEQKTYSESLRKLLCRTTAQYWS